MAPRSAFVSAMGARARIRRHARGAIFIEALIVIVAMILLFTGIIFAVTYYSLRLQALRSARTAGAALAFYGCDRGMNAGDVLSAGDLKGIQLGNAEMAPLTSFKPDMQSPSTEANASIEDVSSRTTPLFPKAVIVRAQGAVNVQGGSSDSVLSGTSKSTTYILCNDESKDGNVTDIIPIIGKFTFF